MKRILITILYIWIVSQVHSQDPESYLLNTNPDFLQIEEPNAASFSKFVDNPISLYNGTPDISIPLHLLKDGTIELPFTLRYNTSGIKVNEEASWVGLGWNLNVGGIITRNVVGEIDRYNSFDSCYDGVMNAIDEKRIFTNDSHLKGPWSQKIRDAFDWHLTEPSLRNIQNEGRYNPDVFYYSYPGGAGKFIIDNRDNKIHILSRNDATKIELVTGSDIRGVIIDSSGSHLNGFKITQPNGIVHHFKLLTSMLIARPTSTSIQSEVYVLTKTVYLNEEEVKYEYEEIPTQSFGYNELARSVVPSSSKRVDSNSVIGDNHMEKTYVSKSLLVGSGKEFVLRKIETTNYVVDFQSSSREDLPNVKKLNKIIIKHKNTTLFPYFKEYRFNYDYTTSNIGEFYWSSSMKNAIGTAREATHFTKRLRLLSVYNIGGNSKTDKYNFYYNSTTLPRKDSFAVDYWGNYNGQVNNKSFIPDLAPLMRHKLEEYSKIKSLPSPNNGTLQSAQRAYNFEHCKAGILEGIQYPTGGYTEFIYEPNKFLDYHIPTIEQTKSNSHLIVKTIIDNNSITTPSQLYPSMKNYFYTFPKETFVEIILTLNRGKNSWLDMTGHEAYITAYGTRTELNVKDECYMRHINETHHNKPQDDVIKITKNIKLKGSGYFVVHIPDELGNQTGQYGNQGYIMMKVSAEKESATEKVESDGAGLRIKEIKAYDSPTKAKLLQQTKYDYVDPATNLCSGILQKKLSFIKYYPQTYDMLGKISTNLCGGTEVSTITIESNKIEIGGYNFTSNPYQSFSYVGYTYIKETKIDNSQNSGHTIYKYHNTEPKTEEHSVMVNDPLNGKLSEVKLYDSIGRLIKEENFKYNSQVSNYYFGLNFYDRMNLFPQIFQRSGWSYLEMSNNNEGFFWGLCLKKYMRMQMKFNQQTFEETYLAGRTRLALIFYPLNAHNVTLTSKETTQDNVKIKEVYEYNPITLQLKNKSTITSDGETLKHTYTYPNDYNCGIYSTMTKKNILSPIIEQQVFRNSKFIGSQLTEYAYSKDNKMTLPSKHYFSETEALLASPSSFSCTGVNRTIYPYINNEYKKYDDYGNIIEMERNRKSIIYLWSYKGQYPIAQIQNATYQEVKNALGGIAPESLSLSESPNINLINGLRTSLANAHITTYVYKPLWGIIEAKSPSELTTFYDYDSFGRLCEVYIKKNGVKEILESYKYNHVNK